MAAISYQDDVEQLHVVAAHPGVRIIFELPLRELLTQHQVSYPDVIFVLRRGAVVDAYRTLDGRRLLIVVGHDMDGRLLTIICHLMFNDCVVALHSLKIGGVNVEGREEGGKTFEQ